MKRSIIKIRDMSLKHNNKYIFKDFDLDIYEGSFTVILGKNNSGKSSLVRVLSGIENGEGYINIDGYLLNNYFMNKIRRNFSICLNDDKIMFDTVRDYLAFPLENLQYTKKEINTQIDKISKKFNIDNILDKSFDEISISQRNKVLIAGTVINNPKMILLDNTLDELTPSDKKSVMKVLKEYQKNYKLTSILITNDIENTLLGDSLIFLDNGKIVLEGSPEEIYKNDSLEKIGFELPFIVKLSQSLILYDLLDKVYFTNKEVIDKLWN